MGCSVRQVLLDCAQPQQRNFDTVLLQIRHPFGCVIFVEATRNKTNIQCPAAPPRPPPFGRPVLAALREVRVAGRVDCESVRQPGVKRGSDMALVRPRKRNALVPASSTTCGMGRPRNDARPEELASSPL